MNFILIGNAREAAVGHVRREIHRAEFLRFLDGLLAPAAGDDVIGARIKRQKIHRHHGELQTGAALQKKDRVVFGNVEQPAQTSFRALDNFVEGFGAMANLHHRHADTGKREQISLRFFQNRNRNYRGPGAEIKNAFSHLNSSEK